MMTRRLVRTATQLGAFAVAVLFLLLFLDKRYEVLPNAIHNRLPLHHPGFVITDITVRTCSSVNPFKSCILDPQIWDRIDKDLYLGKSWTSAAYLHVRRHQEEDITPDVQVVLDIRFGRHNPGQQEGAKAGDVWEQRAEGLWILRSPGRRQVDSQQAVTAVDILFGPDAVDPRIGWTVRSIPLVLDNSNTGLEPHITFRAGSPKHPEKPVLRIRSNGKFKIMQAADLHLSTGVGVCRDPEPAGRHCEADTRTLEFVGKLLDQEKPDLVVLSGDQVNGETSPDVQSAIFKFADLFIKREMPYAAIFGNHDDESTFTRSTTMMLLEELPYSLSSPGPSTISGVGNYVLEVQAPGSSTQSAMSLYLLDTHSYSPDERQFHGYNWLKDDQIKWFRETAHSLRERHRKYSKHHLDMAFIHIPLPEYRNENNRIVPPSGWREGVTAPYFNSGFRDALVDEGVLVVSAGHDHANDYCSLEKQAESHAVQPGVDVKRRDLEVDLHHVQHQRATGHGDSTGFTPKGHHAPRQNQQAVAGGIISKPHAVEGGSKEGRPALWMCYGGGSGFGGYGGYGGYVRRIRFFEIETNGAQITTWKRLEAGKTEDRIDELTLVSEGRVVDR